MQALDRLHDLLRQLARPIPDGLYRDDEGEVRLAVFSMNWDAYVHLAFDEIRLAGAGSPQVTRRLKAALTHLSSIVPPDRQAVLDEQLELLTAATEAALDDTRDVEMALREDREGIGRQRHLGGVIEPLPRPAKQVASASELGLGNAHRSRDCRWRDAGSSAAERASGRGRTLEVSAATDQSAEKSGRRPPFLLVLTPS